MKFYNREAEFKSLNNLKGNFRIAVIGRRRIGKTTLVENFYRENCINFFVSAEKAEKEIIASWAQEYPELHLPVVDNFLSFFDFVFFHLKNKIIFIDETQNFLKVNKSFFFDLQRLIDKYKPKLVVSGSIISLMKNLIEEYKSPLYGRFDLIIKLNELDFKCVYQICKDLKMNIIHAIKLYSVFGGIPKYYELVEKSKEFNFEEFLLSSFIIYPRPLYEEVKTMLKEEFGSEHKTFFTILSAISQGKNKSSEIAGYLGKKETEITKYLSLLREDFEIIERKTPLISGKKGIYSIANNMVHFWFRNVWKYNELLETLQEEKLKEVFIRDLNEIVSKSFEKIILELVRLKILFKQFKFSKIGSNWGNFRGEKGKDSYEIDLVADSEKDNLMLFGECKWQDGINPAEIAKELNRKIDYIEQKDRRSKEILAIFARSFSKRIEEFEGKKVYCFDLKDIEKELLR